MITQVNFCRIVAGVVSGMMTNPVPISDAFKRWKKSGEADPDETLEQFFAATAVDTAQAICVEILKRSQAEEIEEINPFNQPFKKEE